MAVKLTPAGLIGKWVIAPVALLLIGYFLIGPNIGKVPAPKSTTASVSRGEPSGAEPPNADPPPSNQQAAGPEVRVSAHRLADGANPDQVADTRPTPRRRRHRSEPKPAEKTPNPAPTTPPPSTTDEGGSAGATTAG